MNKTSFRKITRTSTWTMQSEREPFCRRRLENQLTRSSNLELIVNGKSFFLRMINMIHFLNIAKRILMCSKIILL